jgi:hypothetical protein
MNITDRTYLAIMCLKVRVALMSCRFACEDPLSNISYALPEKDWADMLAKGSRAYLHISFYWFDVEGHCHTY